MPISTEFDPIKFAEYTKRKLQKFARGIAQEVTPNAITNLDYIVTDDVLLSSATLLVMHSSKGDYVTFQICAGPTVILTLIDNWFIDPTITQQQVPKTEYPAKVPAGMTMRLVYHSTSAVPPWVAINYNMELVKT